jgi:hypothetical protein
MRGLADQVLVIVPAGLVDQWRDELERKFGLPTTIAQPGSTPARDVGMDRPVTIASLAAARRDPLLSRLTDTDWDGPRGRGRYFSVQGGPTSCHRRRVDGVIFVSMPFADHSNWLMAVCTRR